MPANAAPHVLLAPHPGSAPGCVKQMLGPSSLYSTTSSGEG